MTRLYRLLVVALVLLSAFLVYLIVRQSRPRPMLFASDVSEDSIASYAARADSLATFADSLERQFDRSGILARPAVGLRLARLNEEIEGLRQAVERWHAAQDAFGRNQAYRECILIYGRASGMCEGLLVEGDSAQ